jgi:hypothetical protein
MSDWESAACQGDRGSNQNREANSAMGLNAHMQYPTLLCFTIASTELPAL